MTTSNYSPAKRQSNLELLRVVSMLLIIAHHYVVNSGILEHLSLSNHPANFLFLILWSMWGKTGINIFILISSYFMCQSNLTLRRYCKVAFEWIFYHYAIYIIMLLAGYETISIQRVCTLLFAPFINANATGSFASSFLVFYLFIPFMNSFIANIGCKEHRRFIFLLLFTFTGLSTFFINRSIFGEVFWFCAVYFIGSYLRLYPPTWSTNLHQSVKLLILSWLLCYASVLSIAFILKCIGMDTPSFSMLTYFVFDANKLGAVLVSIFMFCTFKNLHISYSKAINLFAQTTFGILMIHDNGTLRPLLWKNLLHVDMSYSLTPPILAVRSVLIVFVVFLACSLIDMVRLFFIESPIFQRFYWFEKILKQIWNFVKITLHGMYNAITHITR